MTIENLYIERARLVTGKTTSWEPVKDDNTGLQKMSSTGNPLFSNWCYLAVPKQYFIEKIWPTLVQEAALVYPNAVNIHPDNYEEDRFFSWKIINGDSPYPPAKKPESKPYNQRTGFAGHYIIKCTKYGFCPDTSAFVNGRWQKLDESQIKIGDYFDVVLKIEAHKGQSPGLYISAEGYQLVEIGEAIASESSGDPSKLFGQNGKTLQGVLPQVGAPAISAAPAGQMGLPQSPQPVTGAMPTAPVAPVMPHAVNPAPSMPATTTAYPSNPPAAPAHDFVQNALTGSAVPQQFAPIAGVPTLPSAPAQSIPVATPATTFPGNGIPGLPQAR